MPKALQANCAFPPRLVATQPAQHSARAAPASRHAATDSTLCGTPLRYQQAPVAHRCVSPQSQPLQGHRHDRRSLRLAPPRRQDACGDPRARGASCVSAGRPAARRAPDRDGERAGLRRQVRRRSAQRARGGGRRAAVGRLGLEREVRPSRATQNRTNFQMLPACACRASRLPAAAMCRTDSDRTRQGAA